MFDGIIFPADMLSYFVLVLDKRTKCHVLLLEIIFEITKFLRPVP